MFWAGMTIPGETIGYGGIAPQLLAKASGSHPWGVKRVIEIKENKTVSRLWSCPSEDGRLGF